jgi:hypothetical protein
MGKLRSPQLPPSRTSNPITSFPRMDPPPPYEAASSRSSSAHSNDRLDPDHSLPSQPGLEPVPLPSRGTQQQPQPPRAPDHKRKTEEGCMTFGDGANGCITYGDHASGCMNIGDHTDGCCNYGEYSDGCCNYHSKNGCLLFRATNGG